MAKWCLYFFVVTNSEITKNKIDVKNFWKENQTKKFTLSKKNSKTSYTVFRDFQIIV